MTDSKTLYRNAERDFVVKLDDLTNALQNANSNLEPLRTHIEKQQLKEGDLQQIENARRLIGKCMSDIITAKQNLDSVAEILNTRRASMEVKEIALRSWPKKSYIERMTWIATALFPAGGVSFVFAGGLTNASLATAIVAWIVGSLTLLFSLRALKKDDEDKWKFFENEFGIQNNRMSTMHTTYALHLSAGESKQTYNGLRSERS